MLRGKVNLTLMMGPVVAVPVPKAIIDALTSVTVTTTAGQASGFQLSFTFSSKSPLNTLLLLLGQVGPIIRVIIVVTVNGSSTVLMDGTIAHHQVSPNVETGQSVLNVTGVDLSGVMGLIDFTGFPYPCMPAEARVALIVAKYAVFGMIPMVIPSVFIDIPIITERIPLHEGKDIEYIKKLADEVGYVFYIEPGPTAGMNIAYWGPEIKVGVPQPALNVNMDAHTNVESLSFSFNGAGTTMPIAFVRIPMTHVSIPVPVPNVSILNPPLGLIPPVPAQFEMMGDTSHLSTPQVLSRIIGRASTSTDAVTGEGSLDVVRYGRILKARALVGVRGAGEAFNGLYYVKSVTHKIGRGQYKQDFTLARNGLISTVPKVPA
jgi:hypothetical protein